ncbi:hypothetical protein IU459_36385 [Nocardia amamiensis]|uniref:Outer membrane channel protein CpnT-like N-terminal domain-containing protein n=1 Tax=Nocardia amamiensis TaxID=404578 RepID=A0ABS0D757_9NOCA|nr:hypothetical protein [Nocardia amamiensis]MBF6302953.1 hypothetical protein [Nocardia amamiensis]
MGIEIPHEVALFLNFIGVPYPDIDEDQVRELGRQVREFATNVRATHESATGVITEMGSVYSGISYEALVASWARMSSTHMESLDQSCLVVANALEIAAEVITVVKVAVLAELAALAASYAALMAATAATAGASAAFAAAVRAAASRLVTAMEEMLISYVAAEVIGKAIEPLGHTIERMINGAVFAAASNLLDTPTSDSSSPLPLYIEPDEVLRYAKVLDDHADKILEHAATFADNVKALDFSTSGGPDALVAAAPGSTSITPSGASNPGAARETSPALHELTGAPQTIRGSRMADSVPFDPGRSGSEMSITPEYRNFPAQDGAKTSAQSPMERGDVSRALLASPGLDPSAASVFGIEKGMLATSGDAAPDRPVAMPVAGSANGAVDNVDAGEPHHSSGERPLAAADTVRPGQAVSPDANTRAVGSIRNESSGATDGPGLSNTSQGAGPGTPSSTPWTRSKQAGGKSRTAAKRATLENSERPVASSVVEHEHIQTPWSKMPKRAASAPRVFAPDSAAPAPNLQTDETTAEPKPHSELPDRDVEPTRSTADPARPRRVER